MTTFISSESGSVALNNPTSGITRNYAPVADTGCMQFCGLIFHAITRVAALVEIDVIKHRLHIRAVLKSAFLEPPVQDRRGLIIPAALAQEIIPNFDLFFSRFVSRFKR